MTPGADFELRIKSCAERDMDRLPAREFKRVAKAILSLESSPRRRGCTKLRGKQAYRLRVGKYRVLYTVSDSPSIVEIIAVGHRKDIYR